MAKKRNIIAVLLHMVFILFGIIILLVYYSNIKAFIITSVFVFINIYLLITEFIRKKYRKDVDNIDWKDIGQIFAGALFPVVLTILLPTDVLPSFISGLFAFIIILAGGIISILSYFKRTTFYLLLQHLFLATLISILVVIPSAILIEQIPLNTILSLEFFTTTSSLALALGISMGAIADAKRD